MERSPLADGALALAGAISSVLADRGVMSDAELIERVHRAFARHIPADVRACWDADGHAGGVRR